MSINHNVIDDVPGAYSWSAEFSCPCCGIGTDSSYCAACDAAECGERDYRDPSINVCLVQRAKDEARLAHALKVSREAVERLCRGGGR